MIIISQSPLQLSWLVSWRPQFIGRDHDLDILLFRIFNRLFVCAGCMNLAHSPTHSSVASQLRLESRERVDRQPFTVELR